MTVFTNNCSQRNRPILDEIAKQDRYRQGGKSIIRTQTNEKQLNNSIMWQCKQGLKNQTIVRVLPRKSKGIQEKLCDEK